jgi:hypothetical protein
VKPPVAEAAKEFFTPPLVFRADTKTSVRAQKDGTLACGEAHSRFLGFFRTFLALFALR